MIASVKTANAQFTNIGRQIRQQCCKFRQGNGDIQQGKLLLHGISQLLEFLPLDSHEFGGALLRLGNAFRYMESSEFGAARYEIRLLEGTLRQVLGPELPEFVEEISDAVPTAKLGVWPDSLEAV